MKIGIVNDVPMAAEMLRRAVTIVPGYNVCWIAQNGAEAVALCAQNKPDLVLMDLIMPVMDGVEATRQIMSQSPCAILIVTVSVEANVSRVFEAMGHGAIDAIDAPALGRELSAASAEPLLSKIGAIGKLISKDREANGARPADSRALIALGASAGGPAALANILGALPRTLQAPIIIVQHVDVRFIPGLLDWLARQSSLPVRVADEGGALEPSVVYLAGSSDHLSLISADRLGYTPIPRDAIYRPSINVLFESVAELWPGQAIGVLLTGMGNDGASGLKALRKKGHHTIAQDETTSAVYGMPKVAAQMNAAAEILPLDRIAPRLIESLVKR